MSSISPVTRLRFSQVRLFSRLFEKLSFHRTSRAVFGSLGKSTLVSHGLVGYRRSFPTFAAAQHCADRYNVPSHEHPENVTQHNRLNQTARPSDYSVLFYLQQILDGVHKVLDIGGSAGNLFYCYDHYLKLPTELCWTVFEVPENAVRGRAMAAERGESRLRFIDRLQDSTVADTVLISGALHYFEELPSELIRFLDPPPTHVFINRTPVIAAPTVVTLQDAYEYYAMAPARILSRDALLGSMAAANYDLVDEWAIPELHLSIPLDPKSSASYYSGFYFRRRG